ncbi:hypothetical protein llap_876 [Limosa lapponica baueri]|uniref:Uncharacterized protein n=1 Tax=Limosa lapponica baueri TaxID=1758121 RepID=A0A2I0URY5_LIMLA|nr:hypothetical protein llap_876 [Limosa lapponica baueri]
MSTFPSKPEDGDLHHEKLLSKRQVAALVNNSGGIRMGFGTQNKAEGYGVSMQLNVTSFGKIILHLESWKEGTDEEGQIIAFKTGSLCESTRA